MCQLRDPNIVQVLGVCSTSAPLAVIVEYMKHGDLYQYLQKHDTSGSTSLNRNASQRRAVLSDVTSSHRSAKY